MNELNEMPIEEPTPPEEVQEEQAPAEEQGEEATGVDETPDVAPVQDEIAELEAKKKKYKEDAEYWRREKARQRAEYFKERGREPEPTPPAQKQPLAEPKEADFADYSDYVKALASHEAELAREKWEREETEKRNRADAQERDIALQQGISKGFDKYADFEDVALDQTVPITPTIKDILADNPETAADVAYYLGKNRTEAIQIARMTPSRAAREIARIENEIKQNDKGNQPRPPTKTSGAPPPIKPIGSKNTVSKDPAQMNQAEFEAWRKEQGARPY